jgi:hypothetical protein
MCATIFELLLKFLYDNLLLIILILILIIKNFIKLFLLLLYNNTI